MTGDLGRDQSSGNGVFIARHELLLAAGALLVAAVAISQRGVDQPYAPIDAGAPVVFSGDARVPTDAGAEGDAFDLSGQEPDLEEWCSTRPSEEDRFQAGRGVEQCADPAHGCARQYDIDAGCSPPP